MTDFIDGEHGDGGFIIIGCKVVILLALNEEGNNRFFRVSSSEGADRTLLLSALSVRPSVCQYLVNRNSSTHEIFKE